MTIDGLVGDISYLQEIDEKYQILEKKYPEQKEKINLYKARLISLIHQSQQDTMPYKISNLIRNQFLSDESHLNELECMRAEFGNASVQSSLNRETLRNQLSITQSTAAFGVGAGLLIGSYQMTEKAATRAFLNLRIKHNLLENTMNALAKEKLKPGPFILGDLERIIQQSLPIVGKQMSGAEMKLTDRILISPLQKAGRIALGAVAGAAAGGMVGAVVGLAITAATSDPLNEAEVLEEYSEKL